MIYKDLLLIVPCYNEEEVLYSFYEAVNEELRDIPYIYRFLFVDDGSSDETLAILKELSSKDKDVSYLSFSRNFGKEAAMYAGLKESKEDLVVVMDADLQHEPKRIKEMLEAIENGYDTATTVRKDRKENSFIKKNLARLFYRIMNRLSDMDIYQGSQDYRMMTRPVLEAILELDEYNRFSKGIFNWVGFKVKYIEVEDVERKDGDSKWSFRDLFNYAIEGMISFSTKPLRISVWIGLLFSVFSFLYLITIVVKKLLLDIDVPGYASLMGMILLQGGMLSIFIGILSEYVGKIYLEVKRRPKYVIKEKSTNLETEPYHK